MALALKVSYTGRGGKMEPDEFWFDDDIAQMDLGYGEKAGLQIYRNYTRSFEDHAVARFKESLAHEMLNLADFVRLTSLLTSGVTVS